MKIMVQLQLINVFNAFSIILNHSTPVSGEIRGKNNSVKNGIIRWSLTRACERGAFEVEDSIIALLATARHLAKHSSWREEVRGSLGNNEDGWSTSSLSYILLAALNRIDYLFLCVSIFTHVC